MRESFGCQIAGSKSLKSALKKFVCIRVICASLKDTVSLHFGDKVVIESEHIFHVFSLKLGPAFAGPFFAMFLGWD